MSSEDQLSPLWIQSRRVKAANKPLGQKRVQTDVQLIDHDGASVLKHVVPWAGDSEELLRPVRFLLKVEVDSIRFPSRVQALVDRANVLRYRVLKGASRKLLHKFFREPCPLP